MKILLINPPFEEEASVGNSRSIRYVLNVIQPLGLAYLAAVLEKNNFPVRIIDCFIDSSYKDLFKEILKEKPDVVGITATTPTFEPARFIASKIKDLIPSALLIIGGAHITAQPYETMEYNCFDIGVIGEGETTFLELLKHIQENIREGLGAIRGIVYRQEGKVIITPKREFIKNLDTLPHPARRLLPHLSKYKPTPASYKRLPLATIMTSRGCPSQCTFCDRGVFGNIYRQRRAERVLAEVEEVIGRFGAREIRFFDDLFTLDRERALKICEGFKKKKFKIPWTCLTAVGYVTKDLLKEMKSAGCWQVLYGLESGDSRMLRLLKKGNTLEQNMQAVRWAKEAGLSVRADFIVGTPQETVESLKRTLNFALNMELDYAHFNKFVPYPGTGLYKDLKESGYDFDFRKGCSITDHSRFLYIPQTLAGKNYYTDFINFAHRKFYLRPGYIVKRLLSIKTWDELRGQVKGFFAIARLRSL